MTSVLELLTHPRPAEPARPVPVIEADRARELALDAWREAGLTSTSGRVHFLGTVDGWLARGWGVAFYGTGAAVTLYSCGEPGSWLPGAPPRRLTRPRGSGRLLGVYAGEPLFPGDKSDYRPPDVPGTTLVQAAPAQGAPAQAELALGVFGPDLYLMDYAEAEAGVARLDAAFSARTYGEARSFGLEVDDRRRCLDYYVELVCRAHEDVDVDHLRARSTSDLWQAVRPADDQPFDVEEHPCFGDSGWRPVPTVRGPWADTAFRERFGPIEREWPSGREHLPARHVNAVLAHLRGHGWSVSRDDSLYAAFWPDA